MKKYQRTKKGILKVRYEGQVRSSIRRGHNPPEYQVNEFIIWALKQDIFHKIYDNWVESGYVTEMTPSVDRIDNAVGYIFHNIRLMTWEENKNLATKDRRAGILKSGRSLKAIIQMDLEGKIIAEYCSMKEAERQTGINHNVIRRCCKKDYRKKDKYKWEYAKDV